MSKKHAAVTRIAKYTLLDEVRQKSFIILFVICALAILLVRGCYSGNIMLNGQALDADTLIRFVSKGMFHLIAAGSMLLSALLAMRIFKRDREEGMQSCILSKPVTRRRYVAGKVLGLWLLSVIFMLILHGVVLIMASIHLKTVMPEYLAASLLCSINLLFVVVAVFFFSLLMPDVIAFLCVMGMGVVSFAADGIAALSRGAMGPNQPEAFSELTGWKGIYYLWPKISGIEQVASSLIDREGFQGFLSVYPLVNVLFYILVFGVLLLWRFEQEDIV